MGATLVAEESRNAGVKQAKEGKVESDEEPARKRTVGHEPA